MCDWLPEDCVHCSIDDIWVLAHAQVVVAAPHRDVFPLFHIHRHILKLLCCRVAARGASQDAELAVGVVTLLVFDFLVEERIIVQLSIICGGGEGKGGEGGEGKGRGGRRGEGEGRGGEGREGKGREGKGREGKGREGKGREGKGREGKGREGKGR